MSLTVGSLFSGVGGFELGFEAAGMATAWACEIDKQSRAVYRHNWPDVEIYTDVKEMKGGTIEPVDLLCGGFPCQDLSVAGKRSGLAGKRSGLFFEIARLCRELRPAPRWLVLENVPGLLSSNGARDMGAVIRELHGLGYRGGWRVLDLQWFGVPQRRRRRVFFVLHLGDWRLAAEILFESESVCGDPPPRRKEGKGVAGLTANGVGTCGADDNQGQAGHLIPYCMTAFGEYVSSSFSSCIKSSDHKGATDLIAHTLDGEGFGASEGGTGRGTPLCIHATQDPVVADHAHALGANSMQAVSCYPIDTQMQVRRLMPVECERLMGWPDGHTRYGIDDNGKEIEMADGPRYRMCGNGVAMPHSEWIGRRIMGAI